MRGVTWEVPPPNMPCRMEWDSLSPLTQYYTIFFGCLAVLGAVGYWVANGCLPKRSSGETDNSGSGEVLEECAALLPKAWRPVGSKEEPQGQAATSSSGDQWCVLLDNARFILIWIIVLEPPAPERCT